MASKERNALAELAGKLLEDLYTINVSCAQLNRITTAYRIIAELAKVQDMEYLNPDEARRIVHQRQVDCILKCRAIAEEGAK